MRKKRIIQLVALALLVLGSLTYVWAQEYSDDYVAEPVPDSEAPVDETMDQVTQDPGVEQDPHPDYPDNDHYDQDVADEPPPAEDDY